MRRYGMLALGCVAALVLSACSGATTGATNVADTSATLTGTGQCDQGQVCTWYFEYWQDGLPRSTSVKTPVQGPVTGPRSGAVSADITGLAPDTTYLYVFCASPNDGGSYVCFGPETRPGEPPQDTDIFTTAKTTLTQAWNGARWKVEPSGGLSDAGFDGVSCTPESTCAAVGRVDARTLAERRHGGSWTIQPTPNPTGASDASLAGVSCTTASACTAVGSFSGSFGTTPSGTATLAERWDGASWTLQATPNPDPSFNELEGVSCPSASACMGVGQDGLSPGAALAEGWDGTTWTAKSVPVPSGGTATNLSGVSCTSATACTAVGGYLTSARTDGTLAERWDGTTWALQDSPGEGNLTAVSCASQSACMAVGWFSNGPGVQTPLAERWDGTSWTVESMPLPSGVSSNTGMTGVSCWAATGCTAVGFYVKTVNGLPVDLPLAERWDGTSWTIQNSPGKGQLRAVSCTSSDACVGAGVL